MIIHNFRDSYMLYVTTVSAYFAVLSQIRTVRRKLLSSACTRPLAGWTTATLLFAEISGNLVRRLHSITSCVFDEEIRLHHATTP